MNTVRSIPFDPFPPQNTVIDRDREYDQTAKTEPDAACPVYRSAECPRPATSSLPAIIGTHAERRVSPAILEQRIITLKRELEFANNDRRDLAERNNELRRRIVGFEQMAESLSNKIDEMESTFKTLTGTTPAAFADPIVITSPSYFEDDQVCGYCNRQPGELHARNCRQ